MFPLSLEDQHFLVLAQFRSFTEASEKIGIGQPALSKSIKRLEEKISFKLFIRGHREITLTQAGLKYYDLLREIEVKYIEGVESIGKLKTDISGQIILGGHSSLVINSLANIIGSLNQKHPHLIINTILKNSVQLAKDVQRAKVDLAVVINPITYPDLVVHKLGIEKIALYSNKGLSYRTLYYNPDMINIVSNLKKLKDYKITPIADYEVLAQIISQSKGIGLLPSTVANRFRSLQQVGKTIEKVTRSLIYRYDLPLYPGVLEVKSAILKESR